MFKRLILLSVFIGSYVHAEGWCTLQDGYEITTNGLKSEDVWVRAKLEGGTESHWIQIASTDKGNANVSLALAAQLSGKTLQIYVDEADLNCTSIPAWYDGIRHLTIKR